jgi:AcrR family transcriptional regulator
MVVNRQVKNSPLRRWHETQARAARSHREVKMSTRESSSTQGVILEAALEVIAEDHISGARVRKIAERAGVSTGLVLYYFPTKQALFLAVFDRLIRFYTDQSAFVNDRAIRPEEKLLIMINKQIEYITRRKEYTVIFDFWTQAATDLELREKVKEMFVNWERINAAIIQEGIAAGVFNPAAAKAVSTLVISLTMGAAFQYLVNEEVFDLHAHFGEIYRILSDMLRRPQTNGQQRALDLAAALAPGG